MRSLRRVGRRAPWLRAAVAAMGASADALVLLVVRLGDSTRRIFTGTGVEVRVPASGTPRPLSPEVEEQVVRVVVKAMANARNHPGCRVVVAECRYGRRGLAVQERDDGQGFDAGRAAPAGHCGRAGMRERAAAIGARLTAESAPGRGTTVRLAVPARPTA